MRLDSLELIAERFRAAGDRNVSHEYSRHFPDDDYSVRRRANVHMVCMLSLQYLDSVVLVHFAKYRDSVEGLQLCLEMTNDELFDMLSKINHHYNVRPVSSPYPCHLVARAIKEFIESLTDKEVL